MIVIDPSGMSVVEWCDYTANNLAAVVAPMKIYDESQWQDWARHVVQNRTVSSVGPPNPDKFSDWREWADRFNQAIYALEM